MRKFVFGVLLLGLSLMSGRQVWAGEEACTDPAYPYCYDMTIVNQWACETCPGDLGYICSNTDPREIWFRVIMDVEEIRVFVTMLMVVGVIWDVYIMGLNGTGEIVIYSS